MAPISITTMRDATLQLIWIENEAKLPYLDVTDNMKNMTPYPFPRLSLVGAFTTIPVTLPMSPVFSLNCPPFFLMALIQNCQVVCSSTFIFLHCLSEVTYTNTFDLTHSIAEQEKLRQYCHSSNPNSLSHSHALMETSAILSSSPGAWWFTYKQEQHHQRKQWHAHTKQPGFLLLH